MQDGVTTCVVVWIEIKEHPDDPDLLDVTTCVVVWIEISKTSPKTFTQLSPPAWWCGLKFKIVISLSVPIGHHLRGGVD